jgi:TolB-like protein
VPIWSQSDPKRSCGDIEQEYFTDGVVEDIITALSRIRWLFVIARNSSFTFKGQAVDIKEVGRRLGVRYTLEWAVRKAAEKVRITGQLIDAVTGAHLWADRFERDLTDVFALQDEVTVAVVSAIQPKLLQTEIAMAARRDLGPCLRTTVHRRRRSVRWLSATGLPMNKITDVSDSRSILYGLIATAHRTGPA